MTLTQQIKQSLALYAQRGEFDGTLKSAYNCLRRAKYTDWDIIRPVVIEIIKNRSYL